MKNIAIAISMLTSLSALANDVPNARPFICSLSVGSGNSALKLESFVENERNQVIRYESDQVYLNVTQGHDFDISLEGKKENPRSNRDSFWGNISMASLPRTFTFTVRTPGGLKGNSRVDVIRVDCFDSDLSASLKDEGYLKSAD